MQIPALLYLSYVGFLPTGPLVKLVVGQLPDHPTRRWASRPSTDATNFSGGGLSWRPPRREARGGGPRGGAGQGLVARAPVLEGAQGSGGSCADLVSGCHLAFERVSSRSQGVIVRNGAWTE